MVKSLKKITMPKVSSKSIFDQHYFKIGASVLMIAALIVALFFIKFIPDQSHVGIKVLTGSKTGNYYSVIGKAAAIAKKKKGTIENIDTNGSMDNIKHLGDPGSGPLFALVQNGMPWPEGLEFVAFLTTPETFFLIGPDADRIRSVSDLRNARIGIGPKGSGTAHLAETIFSIPHMKALGIDLSNHSTEEQMKLLKERKLDLGVFVISEQSSFIENALCLEGMQIASLRQGDSVAQRLPFLRTGVIREGLYDPVRNIPASDKFVLKVDTLIVTNGKPRRSQVMGLLSVMTEMSPGFINYNRFFSNTTGLPGSTAAMDFFNNQGIEVLDRYAPLLMDFIPFSSVVQLVMIVSVFFNAMGLANRYRLWRIDANRLEIEDEMKAYFGENLLPGEISSLQPRYDHNTLDQRKALDSLIARLAEVEARCRTQSQSMLVPMGTEMAYRYQEEIISNNLIALKAYRAKFA